MIMPRRTKSLLKLALLIVGALTIYLIVYTGKKHPPKIESSVVIVRGSQFRNKTQNVDHDETLHDKVTTKKPTPKVPEARAEEPRRPTVFTSQEIYENLTFVEEINKGAWKQGFDIDYDDKQWNAEKKLNVIIVPHSHNDPGWLLTFEQYFKTQTKNILDIIVEKLDEKPTRTFIWAEMSYLSLWWAQANETMRSRMRNLIVNTKQLEIVTGGWVMTDEANSFYYAMIEQMIEGHEWLRANVDASVRPRYGWSIDPFGYTPTMAYLLKRMGFDGMLIQRVNYHVKKYMAQNQRLEFNWRQSWSRDETSDIFCHTMPFLSYDIPHSCGPDPGVCCQFDFKRLDGTIPCNWGFLPSVITDDNIEKKAKILLDQYKKKSQLYGYKGNHNVVLIPHGEDFRYDTMKEANDQFLNLEKLIEYMNSRKDWNVNVRFGTLKDYFELAKKNVAHEIDTFSGDFFTYADRGVEYWSGYYTSRPYYKRLDRLVEYYLRSAEILFSYMNVLQSLQTKKPGVVSLSLQIQELYQDLLVARRNMSVFQHHDGITGTAKSHVVLDYQNKLMQSLANCKKIIEQSAAVLTLKNPEGGVPENIFSIDDVQLNSSVLIDLSTTDQEQTVVIFNPSSNKRNEIVSLKVSSPYLEIYDSNGAKITDYQLSLIWDESDAVPINELVFPGDTDATKMAEPFNFDDATFELLFQVKLPPLSLKTYKFKPAPKNVSIHHRFSKIQYIRTAITNADTREFIANKLAVMQLPKSAIELERLDEQVEVAVELDVNSTAYFSLKTGLLLKMVHQGQTIKSQIEFVNYKATGGAYLFLPRGSAINLNYSKLLKWIRIEHFGSIRKRVCSHLTMFIHCVDFFPSLDRANQLDLPSMRIWNLVDLRRGANDELAMRVTSDIRNERIFYTDLNGFQYIKRKTYLDKLPIQGNVYPMPSGAFIQDDKMRMNLLSGQALGVASLNESTLEVFLDRHLDQDDGRGLGQGVEDNRRTPSRFVLQFEPTPADLAELSLPLQKKSFDMLNPVMKLGLAKPTRILDQLKNLITYTSAQGPLTDFVPFGVNTTLPCDLRILNIRTMQKNAADEPHENQVGLILHRLGNGNCPATFKLGDPFRFLSSYVSEAHVLEVKSASLAMATDDESSITDKDDVFARLEPMNIKAFRISFK